MMGIFRKRTILTSLQRDGTSHQLHRHDRDIFFVIIIRVVLMCNRIGNKSYRQRTEKRREEKVRSGTNANTILSGRPIIIFATTCAQDAELWPYERVCVLIYVTFPRVHARRFRADRDRFAIRIYTIIL